MFLLWNGYIKKYKYKKGGAVCWKNNIIRLRECYYNNIPFWHWEIKIKNKVAKNSKFFSKKCEIRNIPKYHSNEMFEVVSFIQFTWTISITLKISFQRFKAPNSLLEIILLNHLYPMITIKVLFDLSIKILFHTGFS